MSEQDRAFYQNIRNKITRQNKFIKVTNEQMRKIVAEVVPNGEAKEVYADAIVQAYIDKHQQNSDIESVNDDVVDSEALVSLNTSFSPTSEQKKELVKTQVASLELGFNLTEQETSSIADSVDNVFNDYESFVTAVGTAIKGYLDHKFDSIERTLTSTTQDLQNHFVVRASGLNEKVTQFAGGMKNDLDSFRNSTSKTKASLLSRFTIK